MKLLVFLPGLGQTPLTWQDQVVDLPDGWKAVAPWLKGTRPNKPADFTFASAADEALALLLPQGVDAAAYCGASVGASVALTAAVRAPDAVSHLVLTGAQVSPSRGAILAQRAGIRLTPKRRLAALNVDKERLLSVLDELASLDLSGHLREVVAPTLVIAGGRDPRAVKEAQELVSALPNATLEVVPDAAADVHLEQPKRFNELLYGFLQEGSGR